MSLVTDQMNRKILVPDFPNRIVSLVPSQTELLFDLGLGDRVVGITKFCIHPDTWFRSKTRVGGTKTVNFDRIAALKPDLIIGNKEENTKTDIEALEQDYPVWMSDIYNLEDNYQMILALGELLGVSDQATTMVDKLKTDFNDLVTPAVIKRVAYFIWKDPYMVAASDTFINVLLHKAGFENVFADQSRYPSINEDTLKAANPELILLSSEPYPFKEKHIEAFNHICPEAKVLIVDGELFSWYGSRLLHSAIYFKGLQEELI